MLLITHFYYNNDYNLSCRTDDDWLATSSLLITATWVATTTLTLILKTKKIENRGSILGLVFTVENTITTVAAVIAVVAVDWLSLINTVY